MYIPAAFREDRLDVLHDAMRQNSFATIVSAAPDGLIATHLPLLLDASQGTYGTLIGHVARENPHWRAFDGETETLAIFQGPHAYISPSWYTSPYAVPTWNYVAVHAYGRPRLVEDDAKLYDIVAKLVETFERQFDYAWDLAARRDYAEKLLKNIVGFELPIARLEGKRKLSQNRSRADQEGVIAGLEGIGDPLGVALAETMRGQIPHKSIANS
jgi:transcriptional regulator